MSFGASRNVQPIDATKRATPFQRGYVRGSIGRFFPNNRAPRMDYMTVGQAHRILARFGTTGEALEKSGRDSMTLWWVLVALVNFIFFLLSFTGFGLAFSPSRLFTSCGISSHGQSCPLRSARSKRRDGYAETE